MDTLILEYLNANNVLSDTRHFAAQNGKDHQEIVGAMKSVQSLGELIVSKELSEEKWLLTDEGSKTVSSGSLEARLFHSISSEGTALEQLKKSFDGFSIAFGKASSKKWVALDKASGVLKKNTENIVDDVQKDLEKLKLGEKLPQKTLDDYKKRKLIEKRVEKYYEISKGPAFSLETQKLATDLTSEMIANGTWSQQGFKAYNFAAKGLMPESGHLHPLMKVRSEFRQIFLEMGFSEMPTNNFVESSFWNFDALFQPQQHPARDAHDTFFVSQPAQCNKEMIPADYMEAVKEMHSNGGSGSIGYQYDWSEQEALKNLLRTHTTAVSSRMLYKLAQTTKSTGEFKPVKLFSIDRVFRNETLDATHLAEFHQIEGLVADYNLTLGNLIGMLYEFFNKLGIKDLRFKPAYNPYTEPSMEVFSFHPGLKKWIEIGNSGIFRPEMLIPMGLPEDVSVIAWGLSLERPTMIKYKLDNIRDLCGHKVNLQMVYDNPLCRIEKH